MLRPVRVSIVRMLISIMQVPIIFGGNLSVSSGSSIRSWASTILIRRTCELVS